MKLLEYILDLIKPHRKKLCKNPIFIYLYYIFNVVDIINQKLLNFLENEIFSLFLLSNHNHKNSIEIIQI